MPTERRRKRDSVNTAELHSRLRESATFPRQVIAEIQRAARHRHLRHPWLRRQARDADLRRPVVPRRLACRATRWRVIANVATPVVTLGTRFAKKPIELKIPITIAGMSFGALSAPAKEALGRGATIAGTSHHHRRRRHDRRKSASTRSLLVYQVLPSRYGMNPTTCAAPMRSKWWSARAPSPAAAACCSARRSPSAWPACATCRPASTSAAPAAIPTGPARTI
jgi:glutamate synthase domain-containing protein 2